jgi:hypothetical protein
MALKASDLQQMLQQHKKGVLLPCEGVSHEYLQQPAAVASDVERAPHLYTRFEPRRGLMHGMMQPSWFMFVADAVAELTRYVVS